MADKRYNPGPFVPFTRADGSPGAYVEQCAGKRELRVDVIVPIPDNKPWRSGWAQLLEQAIERAILAVINVPDEAQPDTRTPTTRADDTARELFDAMDEYTRATVYTLLRLDGWNEERAGRVRRKGLA